MKKIFSFFLLFNYCYLSYSQFHITNINDTKNFKVELTKYLLNSNKIKSFTQYTFNDFENLDYKSEIIECHFDVDGFMINYKKGYNNKIENSFTYEKSKNIFQLKVFDYASQQLILNTKLQFEEDGKVLRENVYTSDNKEFKNSIYFFNKNGSLVEIKTKDISGGVQIEKLDNQGRYISNILKPNNKDSLCTYYIYEKNKKKYK